MENEQDIKKGDGVVITHSYGAGVPGKQGTVVKTWTVRKGPLKGMNYACVLTGYNQSGQKLQNTYPFNVLRRA